MTRHATRNNTTCIELPVDLANNVKPRVIIDGIEAFSQREIQILCRKIRDTESKIKYIIMSTPDLQTNFYQHCRDGNRFKRYFLGALTYDEAKRYLMGSECGMTEEQACQTYGVFGGDLSELTLACNGENIYDMLHQFNNQWKKNFVHETLINFDDEMKTLAMALAESEDNEIDCEPYHDSWELLKSNYSGIITMDHYLRCHFTNNMYKHFFTLRYKKLSVQEIKDKINSSCQEKVQS